MDRWPAVSGQRPAASGHRSAVSGQRYDGRAMAPSYVSGPSSLPLLGETIGRCLDRISDAWPASDALISCHQRQRFTYEELRAEANRIARGLLALGVERGDRIGIWSPNCAEWLVVQY